MEKKLNQISIKITENELKKIDDYIKEMKEILNLELTRSEVVRLALTQLNNFSNTK